MNIFKKITNFLKSSKNSRAFGDVPIGSTFIFENVKYKVESDEKLPILEDCCNHCSMRNLTSCASMRCMKGERSDHKSTHFKEIHNG